MIINLAVVTMYDQPWGSSSAPPGHTSQNVKFSSFSGQCKLAIAGIDVASPV